MTLPLIRRQAPRPRRRRIVSVTNYWSRDDAGVIRRRVLVSEDGRLVHVYFPDDHPVLVAYLRDLAVSA
jgi:hypothetical protein